MTPRILFVDHVGVMGGAELSLLDIARMTEGGRVLLFEDGPFRARLEASGVPVAVLAAPATVMEVTREGGRWDDIKSMPGVLLLAIRLARLARKYDLLYANSQKAFVVSALAGRLARRPVIWHLRDMMTADHFSPIKRKVAATLGNRFAVKILANSRATAEAFFAIGGRPEQVAVVYNGFDAAPFEQDYQAERGTLRQALGIGERPLVGIFSRLAPWKGQHVLIEALPRMPGVHALLVGEALFGEEKVYAESLRHQIHRLGVADRVHLLGFRDDIPQLLQAVDIVLHTSVAPEPFGRVVVEGMLSGRPVVASKAGGILEIIEDGRTGLLVPPGDPMGLAEAVLQLLSDPLQAGRLSEEGRMSAKARFSHLALIEGVRGAIREVLG